MNFLVNESRSSQKWDTGKKNKIKKVFLNKGQNMLDKQLLDILACPKCKGDLEYKSNDDQLICHNCRLKYNIKEDIPVMLIDESEKF